MQIIWVCGCGCGCAVQVMCRDVEVQGCPVQGCPSAGMSIGVVQMLWCVCIGWGEGGGGGGGGGGEREREMSSIRMYCLEVSCEYIGKS